MIQFYFLSIIFNVVGGCALWIESIARQSPGLDGLRSFLRDRTVRLVLGIISVATGCLKLVTTIRGDIPIVGDFVPACAGIAVGVTILLELYRAVELPVASGSEPENSGLRPLGSRLESLLLANKTTIGIAGIIAGLVHFLFPAVLFL